jgi:hypothetical protein
MAIKGIAPDGTVVFSWESAPASGMRAGGYYRDDATTNDSDENTFVLHRYMPAQAAADVGAPWASRHGRNWEQRGEAASQPLDLRIKFQAFRHLERQEAWFTIPDRATKAIVEVAFTLAPDDVQVLAEHWSIEASAGGGNLKGSDPKTFAEEVSKYSTLEQTRILTITLQNNDTTRTYLLRVGQPSANEYDRLEKQFLRHVDTMNVNEFGIDLQIFHPTTERSEQYQEALSSYLKFGKSNDPFELRNTLDQLIPFSSEKIGGEAMARIFFQQNRFLLAASLSQSASLKKTALFLHAILTNQTDIRTFTLNHPPSSAPLPIPSAAHLEGIEAGLHERDFVEEAEKAAIAEKWFDFAKFALCAHEQVAAKKAPPSDRLRNVLNKLQEQSSERQIIENSEIHKFTRGLAG